MTSSKQTFAEYGSYSFVQKAFHWVSAILVISLFALGLWMDSLDYYSSWYQTAPMVHIGIGVVLVTLTLFRFVWRLHAGVPKSLPNHKSWERLSAKLAHRFFYLAIFTMFITGYLIDTKKGQPLEVFGVFSLPSVITEDELPMLDLVNDLHEFLAFTIIAIVILHAGGALKHHFIDKDKTLKRMTR